MYTGTVPADNEFKVYIKCYMGLCVLCVFVDLSLSGTVLYTCVILIIIIIVCVYCRSSERSAALKATASIQSMLKPQASNTGR